MTDTVTPRASTGRLTVNPGDTIASTWGNTTFDQTAQCYDNAAARDAQWPTPHDGALSYTIDAAVMWLRKAGAWVALVPPAVKASARYTGGGTSSATSLTYVPVTWSGKVFDDANAVNTGTGLWTCQAAGVYLHQFQVGVNTTATNGVTGRSFYKNGAANYALSVTTAPVTYNEAPIVMVDRFVVGDTIACYFATTQTSMTLRGSETFWSIGYLHP